MTRTLDRLEANGTLAALRMRNPGSHVLRMIFGMVGMVGSFYGYVHLPLVTVTALGFTMPLFLTLLAIPILGEKVGWRRWLAVLVGFCGVLLMVRPEQGTTDTEWLALGLCLLGALAWALSCSGSTTLVRRLASFFGWRES